jgi:hypothetical protein
MQSQTQRSRYAAYKRISSLTWGAIDRRCVRIATCRDFRVATQAYKRFHWITWVAIRTQSLRSRNAAYKTTFTQILPVSLSAIFFYFYMPHVFVRPSSRAGAIAYVEHSSLYCNVFQVATGQANRLLYMMFKFDPK